MSNGATNTETTPPSAGAVVDDAREQARAVAGTAADQASSLIGDARQELRNRANEQAAGLGDTLGRLADELRSMAQAPAEGGGVAHRFAEQAADQTARVADRLREGDVATVTDDVKRFARNRPGAFVLLALGSGVIVGRLARNTDLKQVAEAARPDEPEPAVAAPVPAQAVTPAPVAVP